MHQGDLRFCVDVVKLLGRRSRAQRAQVGCVIWNPRKRTIVSVGYNGTPTGESNIMEQNNKTLDTVIHAEDNALRKLWFWETWKCIAIITHSPCSHCADLLIKRKINVVYYLENYGSSTGITKLREAGVTVLRLFDA